MEAGITPAEYMLIWKPLSCAITVAPARACSAAGATGASASAPICAATLRSGITLESNSSFEPKSTGSSKRYSSVTQSQPAVKCLSLTFSAGTRPSTLPSEIAAAQS